ncbi:hypothetical protein [Desulfonema magnum]|uniref:Uncharacterized protein n=1 Tax=Desulfonema magnum TaxID=45655 RepID=A0A975GLP1_9BACT|nr:hypothetical protein [Desulfonema magnum]QTA85018.1 Uncharacterized protein dnm_010220 [Desulfonema magnum]
MEKIIAKNEFFKALRSGQPLSQRMDGRKKNPSAGEGEYCHLEILFPPH